MKTTREHLAWITRTNIARLESAGRLGWNVTEELAFERARLAAFETWLAR